MVVFIVLFQKNCCRLAIFSKTETVLGEFTAYVIYVILLTPAPFSNDTKKTLIPDFLTPKNTKFMIFTPKHTNSQFLTPDGKF